MTEILTRRETGLDVGPLRNLLDGDAVAPGDVEPGLAPCQDFGHAWSPP